MLWREDSHVLSFEDVMCCGGRMSCVVERGCHVLWREDVMCCGGRMSCVEF